MPTPDTEQLNSWFDLEDELPHHDPDNLRRIFFLSNVNGPDREVVICHTENDLQEQLEVGVFAEGAVYTHWLEWFPTRETFQVSIESLQQVAGSAIFPTLPD